MSEKAFRAKVRMYRPGLGDCFLVTLPLTDGTNYNIMIDCGVLLGTTGAAELMRRIVNDIATCTSRHVNLLIATHEHWDHLSGFVQAKAELGRIRFDQVWLGWTENPDDELAQRIRDERQQAVRALHARERALRGFGLTGSANEVSTLLSFFGANSTSTSEALESARGLGKTVRYCSPHDDPVRPDKASFRLYVLGPPRDKKSLRKTNPSKTGRETYGLAASEAARSLFFDDVDQPFDPMKSIPTAVARRMTFFRRQYFAPPAGPENPKADWRNIESAGVANSSELALRLDAATNNTCLVLAIELPDGGVLLFPGDAQVGSWQSWQDLRWKEGRKTVSGPDLLGRTIFYKVGHHGSHNATLQKLGLELMHDLRIAMIPVDRAMAVKKRWMQMPKPELLDALEKRAPNGVIRADRRIPPGAHVRSGPDRLYYEITL